MSKQEDFIYAIVPYVAKYQKKYGFGVVSAIVSQACLESAFGQSNKAGHGNFYGLKYKPNRVTCNSGVFQDKSAEQKPDGTYITIMTNWFEFMPYGVADFDSGSEGYFQFIKSGKYQKAMTQTTPEGYLQALKDCGYATSQKYVENCLNIINRYNLTQFDEVLMPDSSLVSYVKWSPNKTDKRKYKIDTIIIHCMAGNLTVERCGDLFANPSRQASSHYGIGSDGRIAQYVPESARAWTTGGDKKCNGWTGSEYDHRSITIEVANIGGAPNWDISPEALNSTIALCTDICKRRGIVPLWSNDPKLVGDATKQSFALHRWFASKSCPGPAIISFMPYIVMTVQQNLNTPEGYYLNGVDYSPVFDPEYYANKYADLQAAFGNDHAALWNHFVTFGMNELRQASAEFDPRAYIERYEDLRNAFHEDYPMYYWHYCYFGKNEGRIGS